MIKERYAIHCFNEEEHESLQDILFSLGYKWRELNRWNWDYNYPCILLHDTGLDSNILYIGDEYNDDTTYITYSDFERIYGQNKELEQIREYLYKPDQL